LSLIATTAEELGVKNKLLGQYDATVRDIFSIPSEREDELFAGLLLGTGIDLAWMFGGTSVQAFDPHFLEHYHAGLALYMLRDPVATGVGSALIAVDLWSAITNGGNAFGLEEPDPYKSASIAIGALELGVLALQYIWRKS
jgi:hypothetical protein